jgi:cell division protein FtsB
MKAVLVFLIITLGVLQYKLWFAGSGIPEIYRLQAAVDQQLVRNRTMRNTNLALEAEVRDLKSGGQAIEELARRDLGMVKEGEVFYQFVPKKHASS